MPLTPEDKANWIWHGEALAAGDSRTRQIAVYTKTNIISQHLLAFREMALAAIDGQDALEHMRRSHRGMMMWLNMVGCWAIGAQRHYGSIGRVLHRYTQRYLPAPDDPGEMVPLLNMKWRSDEGCVPHAHRVMRE